MEQNQDSIRAFCELGVCQELAQSAASLGWKQPMPIQQKSIPQILSGT